MYMSYWIKGTRVLSPEQGALNQLWLAGAERSKITNGAYYDPVGVIPRIDKIAKSPELGAKLWTWTDQLLDEAMNVGAQGSN